MMQRVPENIRSVKGGEGVFCLSWEPVEGADVQSWQLLRCDYPITTANAPGMLSGGLDLMLQRFELHPSVTEVIEDTGVAGKNYTILGIDSAGGLHFPDGFGLSELGAGTTRLSRENALQGWIKSVKKKDRYSNVF